jgi:hypothetical protein
MGRTKKKIVVETIKTIKCDLCKKELKDDDLVYGYGCYEYCGECFKGILKTRGKIHQLQQKIDKAKECIKEYKELGYSKYDENEIEIELIDKILETLGGENNR